MSKKIFLILALALTLTTAKAYDKVDCSTNDVFTKYSC
jgi:hypothetical protein